MRKQFKEILKKENIIPALITIVIGLVFFVDSNYWDSAVLNFSWLIIFFLFSLAILIVYVYAGMVVIRSLFGVAAGLSLIIFLAQSYCAVPRTESADQALSSLVVVSLLYILFAFSRVMYKELARLYKLTKDDKSKTAEFLVSVFGISLGLFIAAIFKVMYPIVTNLCIYQ